MSALTPALRGDSQVKSLIDLGFLDADGGVLIGLSEKLMQYATVSLTNAQVLALRGTPITLVGAPGAGKVIELCGGAIFFDYTGAYTESADNMAVKYENGSGAAASDTIEATGFVDATADKVIKIVPVKDVLMAVNKALVLHNTGDGEYGGGNAANVVKAFVAYRVYTL